MFFGTPCMPIIRVSQEKVKYMATKFKMINCKNDRIDVKLFDFEVIRNTLNGIFYHMINKSFKSGLIPEKKIAEKFACIRLLIKNNKDPDDLSLYRSLYNI